MIRNNHPVIHKYKTTVFGSTNAFRNGYSARCWQLEIPMERMHWKKKSYEDQNTLLDQSAVAEIILIECSLPHLEPL